MNEIQRYIPFYDLATTKSGYTFDKEVLKNRELIIFGVATIAFTSLSLTFLTSIKIFTLNITPLNTGIFAGALLLSLVFARIVSLKFYQWDKARAENAIIKNRFDSLERNHKGSYNWLVNCDDAISMIKENDVSLKVIQKLLGFAIKYKKHTLINFLWNKLLLSEKKEVLVDLYMQQKNPHPKLLKWLVNNIDALKLLLDENGVDLCKLSSATNPKNILTTAIFMDNCEAFTLLLENITSDDIEIRNFFLKDAINMIVPDFWYRIDDDGENKNLILSLSENFAGNTIEELKLLLLQRFPPYKINDCSIEEESGDEQVYELFDILKGLRDIDSKELYAKVAFILSFKNDNTFIPEFLIKNKRIRPTQFNKKEQKDILTQCLNPFKSKFVRIGHLSGMMDAITLAWINKPCAAAFYKKIPKKLKFTEFSLRKDYDKYQDIWVERLVKLGFDLDAKESYSRNVEWVFNHFDFKYIKQEEIETDGFLKGAHLKTFNDGIKSRCDFITNLRKKIFLERLPLIHHLITENAIYDVARQIFNFYDILSLRPIKLRT